MITIVGAGFGATPPDDPPPEEPPPDDPPPPEEPPLELGALKLIVVSVEDVSK